MELPSFDEKRKSIEFLETCNLAVISEQEIMKHLKILITGYKIFIAHTNPGLVLFRGIKYSDKPDYWEQLIYSPKEKAKINRASAEGQSMFYCSTLKKSVFYELFVKRGDRLVITTWILSKQALFANIGYTIGNLARLGTIRKRPFNSKVLADFDRDDENAIITEFFSGTFPCLGSCHTNRNTQ